MELKQRQAISYEIQAWTGSQWSWVSDGVVCKFGDARTTRRAAQFRTIWSLEIDDSGRPAKRELQ